MICNKEMWYVVKTFFHFLLFSKWFFRSNVLSHGRINSWRAIPIFMHLLCTRLGPRPNQFDYSSASAEIVLNTGNPAKGINCNWLLRTNTSSVTSQSLCVTSTRNQPLNCGRNVVVCVTFSSVICVTLDTGPCISHVIMLV